MKSNYTIAIIPARGGSKGIPRKNLRPLNGYPLIFYSIKACLEAKTIDRVVVSTDDGEIQLFSERFGAEVLLRPTNLANDSTPLDPVIIHAVNEAEKRFNECYNTIVTVQPTSPLITPKDIDEIVTTLQNSNNDTILTACEDKHLKWKEENGELVPAYEARVNRQLLPNVYRETGAVIACKKENLDQGSRVGEKISLHLINQIQSIDIDDYSDLWLCEYLLKQKNIVFVLIGNSKIGMGHVYRAVMLAHELTQHNIRFICFEEDNLAKEYVTSQNYSIEMIPKNQITDRLIELSPDLVINDILDTDPNYILKIKKNDIKVVNFEDMGLGAEVADLVVNALYPYDIPQEHILVGADYFCLRDEFLHIEKRERVGSVKRIMISFGGVDEGDLTGRVLELIAPKIIEKQITVDAVLGPGYIHHDTLNKLIQKLDNPLINIVVSTPKISEYMNRADVVITSGGRTVFELASFGIPTVVISQNFRETKHTFASSENGFINLGLRTEVSDEVIIETVSRLISDDKLRETMVKKIKALNLHFGKKRVIGKILSLLEDQNG